MPFLESKDGAPVGGLTPQTPERLDIQSSATFPELVGTAFDAHTSIGQIANAAGEAWKWSHDVDHTPDESFDPYDDRLITGYEDVSHILGKARNRPEFDAIRERIDKERGQNDELAAAGGRGVMASLAAGIFDPINMIPLGEAKAAYTTGSAVAGLKQGAMVGAGVGAVSEGINQSTRLTPTAEESLLAIGGSTVLFGALGGAAGAYKDAIQAGSLTLRGKAAASMEDIADTMASESRVYADDLARKDGLSIGAAQVKQTTLEQEGLVPASLVPNAVAERLPERVADALDTTQALSFQDPTLRLANSDSITARRVVEQMADSPLQRNKNTEGIASPVPVDSILRQHEGNLETIAPEVYDMFTQYRKGRSKRVGDALITGVSDLVRGAPEGKITFKEFREEVGRAMARNDQHAIPEVAQAAKVYRERIFEPLKNRAIEQGLLPVDVKPETAASYISRVYNKEKIIAQRPVFEEKIVNWLKSKNVDITKNFDENMKQSELTKAHADKHRPMLDAARARMAEVRPKETLYRDQHVAITRETQVLKKQSDRAAAQAKTYRERAAAMTPAQASEEFAKAVRDIKKGVPKKERPLSLSAWIRKQGGIKDFSAELKSRDPGHGIINNKSGAELDDIALRAQEAGFFPEHGDGRLDINTFLDGLDGELKGHSPRYMHGGEHAVAYQEYLDNLAEIIDKAGADINRMPVGQIEALLMKGEKGVADNAANRARLRESEFHAKRYQEAADKAEAELSRREGRRGDIVGKREQNTRDIQQLKQEIADLESIIEINAGKSERFRKLAEDVHYLAGASEDDIRLLAREITDGLVNSAPGRTSYDGVPVTRGPLKERTILVADSDIEEFLDRDIFRLARHYNHTMSTDLELHKAFGSTDLKHQLQAITDDYEALRLAAQKEHGLTPEKMKNGEPVPEELQKELKRLDKRQKADIRDIEGVRDRIRGNYALPSNPQALGYRAFRTIKGINFLRLMGGVTISSFPDLARPLMVHGLTRSFGDGLLPMVQNFRQFKLAASEARLAGTAMDMITNDRALAMAGLDDAWMSTSKFERGVTALTDNYKFISLIAPWTDAIKKFSGVVSQTRSLEAIEALAKGTDIDGAELARLAQFGIDEPMARRMWEQINAHGKKEDGLWWANSGAWKDTQAAITYRSALQREVDKIVVTPGQDKPLFMSTATGGALFQFKTFAFASTQRMLIAGLQQRDLAALNGFMLSMGLGMMTYWAKTDHDKLSDQPQKWMLEGIDRGGALAWFMDVNNTLEKVTGYGINPMLGLPQQSRYASRDAASAVFGPTYGTVFGTMLPAVAGIARGETSRADLHKMRQLLPYQNLFYIRGILDKVEEGAARSLALPESNKK